MKRAAYVLVAAALLLLAAYPVFAQQGEAMVRVVHASPDAPAVDVLVNGNRALTDIEYMTVTPYQTLDPGSYQVQMVPAGEDQPIVIDAMLDLQAGMDYTAIATGLLNDIQPLVLVDDNTPPAAGRTKIRFVHLSPNAPAVDIAVAGGPVLFSNVPFRGVGGYTEVDAGTYNLEVREAGTNNVVLAVPNVAVRGDRVYTVYAMGIVGGEPPLEAVVTFDAQGPTAAEVAAAEPPTILESTENSMLGE